MVPLILDILWVHEESRNLRVEEIGERLGDWAMARWLVFE